MEDLLSEVNKADACKPLRYAGLFLAIGISFGGFGCKRAASPDATYLQIRDEARRGQLDAALHDVDTALGKYQGRSPEWALRFRVQKAHILVLRGAYNGALQLLSDDPPASLGNSEAAVRRKMVQGMALQYCQSFEEADRKLTEAADLAGKNQRNLLGDICQARGNLEVAQKKYLDASTAFHQALTLSRQDQLPLLEASATGGLGYLAMWQEHYDEAIGWFKIALQKSQTLGSEYSIAKALGNIGWNYSVIGDFENAEAFFTEAYTKSALAGLVDDQTRWLNMLAGVYLEEHRYPEADSAEQKALALANNQDDKRLLTECENTMSQIDLATGRLDDADKFNREAAQSAGSDRFWLSSLRLAAGRIEASRRHYEPAQGLFRQVLADAEAETPLKWEAHARLAEVYAAEGQPAKAEREFRVAIGTVQDASQSVQHEEFRLSFLSSAIEFYDAYVNFLIEQRRPLDALKIADLSRAQTLERGLSSESERKREESVSLRPEEIARRQNATLLFYWIGEEQSHLWAIAPTKVSLSTLPGRAEIDALVKSYRDSFTGPLDPLEAGNEDGKKLYATLIQPAEKLIRKSSRVVVLPDGSLNSLNFETFIVPGPKSHYWIEDATVLTGSSLTLLARTAISAPPKKASLLLIGDALQASPDFPSLPQAGKEVGLVENYFPEDNRTVLTGAQATASRFLSSKPEAFLYLHFATHGTASTARPLESAVILSPEGDSYKLYARDIVQHSLHAYLVTISACNGAGMKTYAGEGLVGLAWAFLRAGAHNVIAGLWEVSNASTPQLMAELYKGLKEGKDPATALRDAKLTLVHSTGNYRRPFYWAPFQLYAGS